MSRVSSTATAAIVAAGLAAGCSSGPKSSGSPSTTPATTPVPAATATPTSTPAAVVKPMPPGPRCVPFENRKGCLPVAPSARRVDLTRPVFSRPLQITNPLHPSSVATQVIYGGQVDGKPFRTEFTRLPAAKKTISWEGQRLDAVTWQYLAFSDGRIQEVALDWFAQADDGSVWYLGEDVFNYEDGRVADTGGTWLTGREGPPAMIMPATHRKGDVYRPENAPGVVFEEVTVTATGRTVQGPSGPVTGAVVVNELHQDGTHEDKTFAPGYGEFSTGSPAGDLEAASLAMPVDARPGGVPARLTAVSRAVRTTYEAVGANRWADAATAYRTLSAAWRAYRPGSAVIDRQMSRDLGTLGAVIADRRPGPAHQAALRVAQNELDLRLRYVPLAAIENARADLWRRQIMVDARAGDEAAVAGDRAALKWTSDR